MYHTLYEIIISTFEIEIPFGCFQGQLAACHAVKAKESSRQSICECTDEKKDANADK